jgi:threonine dehydratase
MRGKIYVPTIIKPSKEKKLSSYEINLVKFGEDSEISEVKAREVALETSIPFISPYNDVEVIAGQGTIGIELVDQLEQIDHIFITVGGGGLISGIACVLKEYFPNMKIYGCQPSNSAGMYESVNAGEIIQIDSLDTFSDGSAGGIEKDSITFDFCQELIDEFVLITEDEIKKAMKIAFREFNQVIEGAAGVALAAYLKKENELSGNAVVILCGGNVDLDTWLNIVQN